MRSNWTADAGYYYYETEYYTDSEGEPAVAPGAAHRLALRLGLAQRLLRRRAGVRLQGLPQNLVSKFQTFDTKQLTPYQPQFLAGWRAESYAIDLMPAYNSAQESMANTQRGRCSGDVPGDTQRNLNVQNQFSYVTFKHVLLPIWIAAYRYNDKPYQFLVNGQTGEVVGHAPWSFWKIFFAILAVVAVAVGGYFIYDYTQDRKPPPPAPAQVAAPLPPARTPTVTPPRTVVTTPKPVLKPAPATTGTAVKPK